MKITPEFMELIKDVAQPMYIFDFINLKSDYDSTEFYYKISSGRLYIYRVRQSLVHNLIGETSHGALPVNYWHAIASAMSKVAMNNTYYINLPPPKGFPLPPSIINYVNIEAIPDPRVQNVINMLKSSDEPTRNIGWIAITGKWRKFSWDSGQY